jgi:hypothetical protein
MRLTTGEVVGTGQTDLDGPVREYETLEQMNPNHQMV